MRSLRWWRILTVVAAGSILILSLLPGPLEIPGNVRFADKIAHFAAYAVLGYLIFTSLFKGKELRTVVLVTLLCLLYGGLIEFLQTFTHRQPEIWDLVADAIGAVCGAAAGAGLSRRARSRSEPSRN